MEWLQDNAMVFSAMATVFMALVWLLYAHIGIVSILRHRRPRVIIDQTMEQTLDTKFMIINLSEQTVYISDVLVAIQTGGDETVRKITTYYHVSAEDLHQRPREVQGELRQGLLNSGDLLLLGDAEDLLSWMLEEHEEDTGTTSRERLQSALWDLDAVEIRVIAMVGVEDKPVGSCRRFVIDKEDTTAMIRPEDSHTTHLTSWRERRIVHQWAEEAAQS
jgi:hypothetical protein